MKSTLLALLLLVVSLAGVSNAQCTSETVNSFTLSPGTISGDQSQLATGTIQGCIPSGDQKLVVYITLQGVQGGTIYCYGGLGTEAGTCNWPGSPGNVTFSFAFNAFNHGTTNINATIGANAYGQTPITQPLTITPIGNPYE